MKSDIMKTGPERAPQRSLLKAAGYSDNEIKKPLIGIVNSFNEIVPGHVHLERISRAVKDGVLAAGGTPMEFNTIGVCDDIVKTIFINKELNQKYIEKVLCHELTHAAMFSYNIDLTLEQEEILADLIATYGQEIVHITNLVFKRITEKREGL